MMDSCSSPWNGEEVGTPNTSQYFPDDSGYLSNPGSSGSESNCVRLRRFSCSSPYNSRSPVGYCHNIIPSTSAFQQNCYTNGQLDSLQKTEGAHCDSVLLNDIGCCKESLSLQNKLLAASCREDNLPRLAGSKSYSFLKSSQYSTPTSDRSISLQTASGISDSQTPEKIDLNPCEQSFPKCLFTHCGNENESLYESSIISKSTVPYSWSSKLGKPRIDVLAALASYRPVVSRILQFLRPEDLVAVAAVSHTWRNICKNDKQANRRRQIYLRAKIQLKENKEEYSPYVKAQQHSRRYLRRGACSELQNLCMPSPRKKEPVSPPVSPSKVRFHLFYKEGGKLSQGEHLMPCPRCSLPSHISSSEGYGRCSRPGCLFEFCIHCHSAPHMGKPCRAVLPVLQSHCRRMRNGIGSAASRRNLRKLLL
ncbi:uncharacterized protein LOC124791229 [Schistocerca piceifrons]|uniref:uncharacterized protein LOC124791229 n=1 Tax=Schistocerca piceifrons TaxID=274613 RepID=UPI001F5F1803|nr:uncharacterized protein LOC124791229 [Schistocerca piceifrons]XP_047113800.1 uncharacterized protein LOC124791229 [Schistocerca piceifrons]